MAAASEAAAAAARDDAAAARAAATALRLARLLSDIISASSLRRVGAGGGGQPPGDPPARPSASPASAAAVAAAHPALATRPSEAVQGHLLASFPDVLASLAQLRAVLLAARADVAGAAPGWPGQLAACAAALCEAVASLGGPAAGELDALTLWASNAGSVAARGLHAWGLTAGPESRAEGAERDGEAALATQLAELSVGAGAEAVHGGGDGALGPVGAALARGWPGGLESMAAVDVSCDGLGDAAVALGGAGAALRAYAGGAGLRWCGAALVGEVPTSAAAADEAAARRPALIGPAAEPLSGADAGALACLAASLLTAAAAGDGGEGLAVLLMGRLVLPPRKRARAASVVERLRCAGGLAAGVRHCLLWSWTRDNGFTSAYSWAAIEGPACCFRGARRSSAQPASVAAAARLLSALLGCAVPAVGQAALVWLCDDVAAALPALVRPAGAAESSPGDGAQRARGCDALAAAQAAAFSLSVLQAGAAIGALPLGSLVRAEAAAWAALYATGPPALRVAADGGDAPNSAADAAPPHRGGALEADGEAASEAARLGSVAAEPGVLADVACVALDAWLAAGGSLAASRAAEHPSAAVAGAAQLLRVAAACADLGGQQPAPSMAMRAVAGLRGLVQRADGGGPGGAVVLAALRAAPLAVLAAAALAAAAAAADEGLRMAAAECGAALVAAAQEGAVGAGATASPPPQLPPPPPAEVWAALTEAAWELCGDGSAGVAAAGARLTERLCEAALVASGRGGRGAGAAAWLPAWQVRARAPRRLADDRRSLSSGEERTTCETSLTAGPSPL